MPGVDATTTFSIALNADGGVPGEIMLLPAGPVVKTVDGRGPWRIADAAQLAAESLAAAGGRLAIDENHATDLAAPKGLPSPARGWIVALAARPDGIWATVEWTDAGKELLAQRAYRGVSPVFIHKADGTVTRILRASLTNIPNLRDLVALNQETSVSDFLQKMRAALGLPADADEASVLAKVAGLNGSATALQSALKPLAKAAGLKEDADATAILGAVETLAGNAEKAKTGGDAVTALQAELATVTTALNALKGDRAKELATAYVDGEIAKGRVGVKPLRDHYIAMHAADPARVEKEIGALPVLGKSGASIEPPKDQDGKVALNAVQLAVCKALGLKPEDYQKTLAAEAANEEAA